MRNRFHLILRREKHPWNTTNSIQLQEAFLFFFQQSRFEYLFCCNLNLYEPRYHRYHNKRPYYFELVFTYFTWKLYLLLFVILFIILIFLFIYLCFIYLFVDLFFFFLYSYITITVRVAILLYNQLLVSSNCYLFLLLFLSL